jgi:hypothetical protein
VPGKNILGIYPLGVCPAFVVNRGNAREALLSRVGLGDWHPNGGAPICERPPWWLFGASCVCQFAFEGLTLLGIVVLLLTTALYVANFILAGRGRAMTVPLVGMIVCSVGLLFFAIWHFAAPRPLIVAEPKPAAPAERVFTPRTAHELLALYQGPGRTKIQGDQLIKPHKGLWLKTDGKVMLLAPEDDGSIAVLDNEGDKIECRFGHDWDNALARLNNGDPLKVQGEISQWQNGEQLSLIKCEVIQYQEIEPAEATEWHLSDSQREQLSKVLDDYVGDRFAIQMALPVSSASAQMFGPELADVFQKHNWEVKSSVDLAIKAGLTGIFIAVSKELRDNSEVPSNANVLSGLLEAVGLKPTPTRWNIPRDSFILVIGGKPQ